MELLASRRTVSKLLVSPRYLLRYARSVRAKTFQSTWRRSSPGEYARYSANSWLKPKSGDRCRPATNPSTTVLAMRSRLEISARTIGSRKRCTIRPLSKEACAQEGAGESHPNRYGQIPHGSSTGCGDEAQEWPSP